MLVNGINPALTRPCSFCKKHIMWADTIYRSKRYGGQLHKGCVEQYDRYKEAEMALTGKEATNGMPKMQEQEKPDPTPHTPEEVLRNQRSHLTLVPKVPRSNREANPSGGSADNPVLLGRVIPFPRKT